MLSTPLRRFGNSYYEIESLNMGIYPEIYTVRDKSYNIYIIKNYQRDYPSSNILEEAKICSLLSKISPSFFFKLYFELDWWILCKRKIYSNRIFRKRKLKQLYFIRKFFWGKTRQNFNVENRLWCESHAWKWSST